MTVLLPEVAGAGAETGAAAERTAERRITRRARETASERARRAVQGTPGFYAGQARGLGGAQLTPGTRNYQGIILAEFLAAVLLVAFMPLATGGGTPVTPPEGPAPAAELAAARSGRQAVSRPSPYHVNDLVQLVAIGAVYFVLALISSGGTGRVAAWAGGLVLTGILLGKLASGEVAAAVTGLQGQQGQGGQLA